MNFLRFAAAEVCQQVAVSRSLALTYVNGATVIAAVLGPSLTVLSHVMLPGEKQEQEQEQEKGSRSRSRSRSRASRRSRSRSRARSRQQEQGQERGMEVVKAPRSLVEILSNRLFLMASALMVLGGMAMVVFMAVIPLVMYDVYGYSYGVMTLVMIVHMLNDTH